jgi:hypothetical protein
MQLVNPITTSGTPENCPNRGLELKLFGTDSMGNKTLLVDGSNGASVSCTVGASSYKASVSQSGVGFTVSGTVTQQGASYVSSDAIVAIEVVNGSYETLAATPCSVTFSTYDTGSGGGNSLVMQTISCPDLLNEQGAGEDCAINSTFSANLLSFQNCN